MATLIHLTFAVLWSLVLGVAVDLAARRFFHEPRRSVAAGAIAALAFFIGTLASPFHRAPPAVPTVSNAPAATPPAPPRPCAASESAPSRDAVGSLDGVANRTTSSVIPDGGAVEKHTPLRVYGWAASKDAKTPARGVCLSVDGSIVAGPIVTYGASRPDVAAVLGVPALTASGFTIEFAPAAFPAGRHQLSIVVANGDGTVSAFKTGRSLILR